MANTRSISTLALSALLVAGACTDDGGGGESGASASTDGSGSDSGTMSGAEGNESAMGDGDPGDGDPGDGDPGDGDGDPGDGDGDPGKCEAMDAVGVGPCDAIIGVAWDGVACVTLSGCECEGLDCDKLFDSDKTCEETYIDCLEKDGCGGLELEACTALESCSAIFGQLLELTGDGGWCALESSYLGCSSELICDDAISFACPKEEDTIYQTPDSCLPDLDYLACAAPSDQGSYEPCP